MEHEIYQYVQNLYAYIMNQEQRISHLEQVVNSLQGDLEAVKDQRPYHIDRVEYKFDQLKVERLDGTLTIGLTPLGKEQIDYLSVNDQLKDQVNGFRNENGNFQQVPIQMDDPLYSKVHQNVSRYLDHDVYHEIGKMEKEHNVPLDEGYKFFMVDDIRKQADQRINNYIQQFGAIENGSSDLEQYVQKISEQVRKDIHMALISYLKHFPKEDTSQ